MKVPAAGSLALGLACVALSACNGEEPAPRRTACKVVLGVMGDLTPGSGAGIDMFRGVELAVEEARSRGRLDCDIELQIEDTRGDAKLAGDHARSMIKNDDLVACLCGFTDEEALAAAPVMSGAGILISGPAPSDAIPEQGFDTWFAAAPTNEVEAAATIAYINSLGAIEGLAVIDDGSELGVAMADRIANPLGGLVKARVGAETEDLGAELKGRDVPLIYVGAEEEGAARIAGELRAAGIEATIIANAPALSGGAPPRVKEGYQVACPCVDPPMLPTGEDFAQAFGEAYDEPPGPYAAEMYDVAHLVIAALERAELPAEVAEIRAAIVEHFATATGAEGISGPLAWSPAGELNAEPGADVWIYDWQASAGAFLGLGPVSALR